MIYREIKARYSEVIEISADPRDEFSITINGAFPEECGHCDLTIEQAIKLRDTLSEMIDRLEKEPSE